MATPTPVSIGNKFVVSYYTYMNRDPDSLRFFYKENSILTHGSESNFGTADEMHIGVEEINKKSNNLTFGIAK